MRIHKPTLYFFILSPRPLQQHGLEKASTSVGTALPGVTPRVYDFFPGKDFLCV